MYPRLLSLKHTTNTTDTLDFCILGKSYTLNINKPNEPLHLKIQIIYENQGYQNVG